MLTKKYQNQSNAIASYDFTDIVSGKGYKKFYACRTSSGDILTPEIIGSGYIDGQVSSNNVQGIVTMATANTDVLLKLIDLTFTTTFDTPRIVDGNAIISATIGGDSAGNTTSKFYKIVADVYKNSTFLVSGSTAIIQGKTTASPGDEESFQCAIVVDIPNTLFAVGDTLKLEMEYWQRKTAGDPGTTRIAAAHDPLERTDINTGLPLITAATSTKLEFDVPFVIDI